MSINETITKYLPTLSDFTDSSMSSVNTTINSNIDKLRNFGLSEDEILAVIVTWLDNLYGENWNEEES